MVTLPNVLKTLGILWSVSVWCASANPVVERPGPSIEIRRTTDGIPHILAHSWHDLGYGYGHAQAEDALCTLAEAFITFRGHRAYFFDSESRPREESTFGRSRNIELDFFFRTFADDHRVAEYRDHQPPELIQLIKGFAAGYNRYLDNVRKLADSALEKQKPCLREPWVDEITPEDVYRRVIAVNLAAGYTKFIPEIVNASPPSLDRGNLSKSSGPSETPLSTRLSHFPGGIAGLGSNMIAFGRQATGAETGVLFGNPHWFWGGPDRFYQAHLTIPGKLNVAGVSFLGYPFIMLGFNEQVAWSHTVSTARRMGLYEISLDSNRPTVYQIDDKLEAMREVLITVHARGPDDKPIKITRTLYRTRFGPVVDLGIHDKTFSWNTSKALAVRDVNESNFNVLRNFFLLGPIAITQ